MLINRHQCQGIFAFFRAPQVERPNVDVGLAQKRAQSSNKTRFVIIDDEQHLWGQFRFHVDSVHFDDTRFLVGKQSARNIPSAMLGGDGKADQRVIVALPIMDNLGHLDVALLGDHRRVDHVDRLQQRRQQSLQHDRR